MNRLTERDEYGNADIIGVDSEDLQLNLDFEGFNRVTEALNRLAAYEDTGLTPAGVFALQTHPDHAYADYVKKMLHENGGMERMEELAKANAEGRLVVLPCKVGDTVFSAFENEGVFCGKVYAISTCDGTNWFSVRYDGGLRYDHTWDEIGKTVFFAREDAEKALGGMKNDER